MPCTWNLWASLHCLGPQQGAMWCHRTTAFLLPFFQICNDTTCFILGKSDGSFLPYLSSQPRPITVTTDCEGYVQVGLGAHHFTGVQHLLVVKVECRNTMWHRQLYLYTESTTSTCLSILQQDKFCQPVRPLTCILYVFQGKFTQAQNISLPSLLFFQLFTHFFFNYKVLEKMWFSTLI